jgi:hypothetical protein
MFLAVGLALVFVGFGLLDDMGGGWFFLMAFVAFSFVWLFNVVVKYVSNRI